MEENKWDLEQIMPIDGLRNNLKKTSDEIKILKSEILSLSPEIDSKLFTKVINHFESVLDKIYILNARVSLNIEVDLKNQNLRYLESLNTNLVKEFEEVSRTLFLWIKGKEDINNKKLDLHNAKRLFDSIKDKSYFFKRERELAKYSLSSDEEAIIFNKDLYGINTVLELRTLIENKQEYSVEIDGKREIFKTIAELSKFFESPKRQNRINSYNSLYEQIEKNETEYSSIYQSVVKDYNYSAKLRGFKSPISVMNISNDVSDEIVDNLFKACDNHISIFHKYFSIKSKFLNIKDFSRYDLYAPVNYESKKEISIDEAKENILKLYKELDIEFYDKAKTLIDGQFIDYFPRENKKSGGFCAGITPTNKPFILLNYTGSSRDFVTMAHEIGHGIHFMFSGTQSILNYNAPLILAETGSTLGELMAFDFLIKNTKSIEEKIGLLFNKISDIYASIIRQIYFEKFEIEAHEKIPSGISLDEINSIYLTNLKTQFGKSVSVPEIFKREWMYIPHIFHTPFYCYSYPFGQLLGISLYRLIKDNKKENLPKIKKILSAGSSEKPERLLKSIGIDISDPKFWDEGFEYIESLIEDLQKELKS